jgi:Spy/CpxP family protein refolding chaperone
MKKLIVLVALFVTVYSTSANAQQQGGGMTPEQRAERMKQTKADLVAKAKITEAEADKVLEIQQASRAGMRGLRDLSEEDRKKKMDEINADNTKKFAAIPLTEEQVKAVNAYFEEQRKNMQNRQGGGNGGNGNGGGNK